MIYTKMFIISVQGRKNRIYIVVVFVVIYTKKVHISHDTVDGRL